MRKFFIYTLFSPMLCLIFFWGIIHFYEPTSKYGFFNFEKEKNKIYGVDGLEIHFTDYKINKSNQPTPLLVFVADTSLDRDWNAQNFKFKSGKLLANALASNGFRVITYDQRGTGSSYANENTINNLSLKLEDLKTIYEYSKKLRYSNLFFLAHGNEACATLLYAIDKWNWQNQIKGVVLIGCGGDGSLLDLWKSKLLFNMKRNGVKVKDLEKATIVLNKYFENSSYNISTLNELIKKDFNSGGVDKNNSGGVGKNNKSGGVDKDNNSGGVEKDNISSDLKTFHNALLNFSKKDWDEYRLLAPKIYTQNLIKKLLSQGVNVLHLQSSFDEERPLKELNETIEFSNKNSNFKNYKFKKIMSSDYFLREQDKIYTGLPLVVTRLNPFRNLEKNYIEEIKYFVLNNF